MTACSVCAQHPAVPAVDVCRSCGTPVCGTCAFPATHGGQICPNCASYEVADAPPALPRLSQLPAGVHCVQHPHVAAIAQCKRCGAFVCATCDFALPDGNHLCPACATASQTELSPHRKRALGWAYGLAIWSTLMLVLLFTGALIDSVETEEEETLIGIVFLVVVLFPSIAGISVGVSARSRQASNPISLWIAIVWNSVILGIFLLCA